MTTLDKKNPTEKIHRQWSIENEIKLFSLLCDYKPAGKKKQQNIEVIIKNINESLDSNEEPFSEYDVWNKLRSLYDLEKIGQIEELLNENTSTDENTNQTLERPASITKDTKNTKNTLNAKDVIQDKKEMGQERSGSTSSLSTPEPPQRRTRSARETTKSKLNSRDTPKEKPQHNDEKTTLDGTEKSKVEVSSTSDHTDDQSPTSGRIKKSSDELLGGNMSDNDNVNKAKGNEKTAKIKEENISEQEEENVGGDEKANKNKDTNEDEDEEDVEVIEESDTDKENESSSEESSPEPMTKRTRQRTRSAHEKPASSNIKTRTRQSVKFDDKSSEPSPTVTDAGSRKRRAQPGSVSPPHPPKTRRRTRSVAHEEEEDDATTHSTDEAEPEIIKMETRQTTRRSSRILTESSTSTSTPNIKVRRSSRKR